MNTRTTIPTRIKSLREYQGWSQTELAERSHVGQSYISRLEDGDAPNVAGIILAKLARALETSTDYLLGLTDNPAIAPSPNHPALKDPRVHRILEAWQSLAVLNDPEPLDLIHDIAVELARRRTAKED